MGISNWANYDILSLLIPVIDNDRGKKLLEHENECVYKLEKEKKRNYIKEQYVISRE